MKKVSVQRFEDTILLVHPNAKIETRDGTEYVVIPTYDFDTDVSGEVLLLLDREPGPKFKPGDTLRHTENGSQMNVVDPMAALISSRLRKGPNVEDDGV